MFGAEQQRPSDRFPILNTRSGGETPRPVAPILGNRSLDRQQSTGDFDTGFDHCPLRSIGLFYASYDTPLHLQFSEVNFFAEQFWIRGSAEMTVDGTRVALTPHQASVISPGAQVSLDCSADFQQFVLRVEPKALASKLAHLTGIHCTHALKFQPAANLQSPEAHSLRQVLLFLTAQFESGDFKLPALALAEFEEALMVSFLCANRHNYSHLLDRQPSQAAPWQVRRAEQYIEAHWDQPITVEALAIATGASTRSIFYLFKQSRGCSPMEFLKQNRLQHAKEMLTSARAETSVTKVAFACGFGNLGHFAKDY